MARRMIFMLATVVAFLGILGFYKYRQIQAAMSQSYQPPPEAVTTIVAKQASWPATLSAIGSVTAVQGVTVSADLPGVVRKIAFDSGTRVAAGDLLVELDTRQEVAQLAAAEARLELARLNLGRTKGLREEGVTSAADYDQALAEHTQAEAAVGEIKATIARKTIRAPFTGTLGIRQANLGEYLNSGAPIVPLQKLSPVYVDFSVPQHELAKVRIGGEVKVEAEGVGAAESTGRITAVDATVDEATRNARIRATLENAKALLRPGMFVTAQLVLDSAETVVSVPASAIRYAPYGDSVFLVEDVKGPDGKTFRGVRQQFVKLGPARGDQIAIRSGVPDGAEVVTSGVFKLRNGAAVLVNNEVQPSNEAAPKPEDS